MSAVALPSRPRWPWLTPAVERLLDLAIEEDLGRGDATTAAVLKNDPDAEGELVAKERLTLAGIGLCEAVFARLDWRVRVRLRAGDGDEVQPGAVVATVRGPASALLAGERTALNFVQRLSGVATLTAAFVRAARGAKVRIADTRKTTPGLRALERYAVKVGGGANHRNDLGAGILIKDNHVALVGGVGEAVRRARRSASHGMRIEVEIDTLDQFEEVIEAGADIVLLDNFATREIADAVRRNKRRVVLECSGGVTLERVRELVKTGVDIISVGAITHSARAVDLSLDIRTPSA